MLRGMTAESERRTQLLRGTLDTCLLALLAEQPTHAYDLVVRLEDRGLSGVGYGTVYPLMGRLRRQGLVTERVEASPSGPPRKVFEVSASGLRALKQWTQLWSETTATISGVLADAGVLDTTEEPSRA